MTVESMRLFDELYEVAVDEVKKRPVDNHKLEELYENPDIWYDSLVKLKRELELQLTDKRGELREMKIKLADDEDKLNAYLRKQDEWRVNVIRFIISIETRLRYVKRIKHNL